MQIDFLFKYYKAVAAFMGRGMSEGKNPKPLRFRKNNGYRSKSNFSYYDAFTDDFGWNQDNVNLLVKAYFGEIDSLSALNAMIEENDVNKLLSASSLNESQRTAVSNAVNYPLSVIKGPPGTGKTETILHIISVLHQLHSDSSIAIAAQNKEAIGNIADEIQNGRFSKLSDCFAVLGNRENRKKQVNALSANSDEYELADNTIRSKATGKVLMRKIVLNLKKKQIEWKCTKAHLEAFPIFTSTIHSLHKIFLTGDTDESINGQFDYVIVDECSLVNGSLGLAVMAMAKRLIIVGDDDQLAPIINEKDDLSELNRYYLSLLRSQRDKNLFRTKYMLGFEQKLDPRNAPEEKSFIRLCLDIFNEKNAYTAPVTALNVHYRCHPAIFGFCRENIYQNIQDMSIFRKDKGCPMRVRWYEGSYFERQDKPVKGKTVSTHTNRRQISIFTNEEWPLLKARFKECIAANKQLPSVCVLCPYKDPIKDIKDMISLDIENDAALRDYVSVSGGEESEDNADIFCLTIHKSQGKGKDIVYLLTGMDLIPEDIDPLTGEFEAPPRPWNQKRRMINVAVSRAKEEFVLITSANSLPVQYLRDYNKNVGKKDKVSISKEQIKLCNMIKKPSKKMSEELFILRLASYIYEQTQADSFSQWNRNTGNMYGFIRSEYRSVFDKTSYVCTLFSKETHSGSGIGRSASANEIVVWKSLVDMFGTDEQINTTLSKIGIELPKTVKLKNGYILSREVPLCELNQKVKRNFSFDYIISREVKTTRGKIKNKLLLAVEIDGNVHRRSVISENENVSLSQRERLDNEKNTFFKNRFKGINVSVIGSGEKSDSELKENTFLLRISTEGNTKNESEIIKQLVLQNDKSDIEIYY